MAQETSCAVKAKHLNTWNLWAHAAALRCAENCNCNAAKITTGIAMVGGNSATKTIKETRPNRAARSRAAGALGQRTLHPRNSTAISRSLIYNSQIQQDLDVGCICAFNTFKTFCTFLYLFFIIFLFFYIKGIYCMCLTIYKTKVLEHWLLKKIEGTLKWQLFNASWASVWRNQYSSWLYLSRAR